ncbi:MAG: hypothetical protein NT029_04550 [Armatimonadetes bacterium]|nr:hypothetical protein [Armatimonadota bacterium]
MTMRAATNLAPMSLSDVLDAAFDLYKSHFVLFAGIAAVVAVPAYLIDRLVSHWLGIYRLMERISSSNQPPDAAAVGAMMLYFLMAATVMSISFVLQSGALTSAIAQRVLGRPASLSSAYRSVRRAFWRLLGAWSLVGVVWCAFAGAASIGAGIIIGVAVAATAAGGTTAVATAVFAGVMAGLAIAVAMALVAVMTSVFVTQIVMIEQRPATETLNRQWALAKGQVWRLAVACMTVSLGSALLVGTTYASMDALLEYAVFPALHVPYEVQITASSIVSTLIGMLAQPFICTAFTLLYFDQRVRREGFDLDVLSQSSHWHGSAGC